MSSLHYLCDCGHSFPFSLGAHGCPNCCGDSGPTKAMTPERAAIIRMARQAGLIHKADDGQYLDFLTHFAILVKADFLERTGQYVTNDATREAAIADAVAAEREACAVLCEDMVLYTGYDCAASIRARGTP